MKNFPHQFNNLSKLFNALEIAKTLVMEGTPLNDDNFGEQLTRHHIYTYRNKDLSVAEFLAVEQQKPISKRGHLTVARDIKRFFHLIGFIIINNERLEALTPTAERLLATTSDEIRKQIWKDSLLNMEIEGTDGETSHPYRILLKLVEDQPGIETNKLMLALEAENDSDEEYERICLLSNRTLEQIIEDTGITKPKAANAVKILPGIAEQIGDIFRKHNCAYPIEKLIVTEDEIAAIENVYRQHRTNFRETNADEIARNPNINIVLPTSIDLTEAIRIRQRRLVEHQRIVRQLALLNSQQGFQLFEGKFDCLAIKRNTALLYEVKTILRTSSDAEKQTIKGVGQLKYYKFSIVFSEMHYTNIKEIITFSNKPETQIIDFCLAEGILTIWLDDANFMIFNPTNNRDEIFNPDNFL